MWLVACGAPRLMLNTAIAPAPELLSRPRCGVHRCRPRRQRAGAQGAAPWRFPAAQLHDCRAAALPGGPQPRRSANGTAEGKRLTRSPAEEHGCQHAGHHEPCPLGAHDVHSIDRARRGAFNSCCTARRWSAGAWRDAALGCSSLRGVRCVRQLQGFCYGACVRAWGYGLCEQPHIFLESARAYSLAHWPGRPKGSMPGAPGSRRQPLAR